ncbi:MAG: hypothetical protein NTV29_13925 [Planctomycetota bacterium]|nr:hypothetical protein [Planctomycetota bacterium]
MKRSISNCITICNAICIAIRSTVVRPRVGVLALKHSALKLVALLLFELLLFGLGSSPIFADIVELKNGGVIYGKVLNPQSGLMVQIEAEDGTLIEVERKFAKIRISLDRDKKYAQDVQQRGDSLEDHRAIVEKCSSEQMNNIANAHRERIVELDPSDRSTWEALRFFPDEATGKWLRRDVVMYRRGKIKGENGRWLTWQEKALFDFDANTKLQKRDLEREFDGKLKAYFNGVPRLKGEAEVYLDRVNNPLLIGRIVKLIREGDPAERQLGLKLIAQIPVRSASPALISMAMEEPNIAVVDSVLNQLQAGDDATREAALSGFASQLGNPSTRDRAAHCMSPFVDKRYISILINHLLSEQVVRPAGNPGGINAGAGSGGIGLGGGATPAQKRIVQHKDVLSALSGLTGQNFGYNVDQWRVWFAQNHAVQNLDLRRDEY